MPVGHFFEGLRPFVTMATIGGVARLRLVEVRAVPAGVPAALRVWHEPQKTPGLQEQLLADGGVPRLCSAGEAVAGRSSVTTSRTSTIARAHRRERSATGTRAARAEARPRPGRGGARRVRVRRLERRSARKRGRRGAQDARPARRRLRPAARAAAPRAWAPAREGGLRPAVGGRLRAADADDAAVVPRLPAGSLLRGSGPAAQGVAPGREAVDLGAPGGG